MEAKKLISNKILFIAITLSLIAVVFSVYYSSKSESRLPEILHSLAIISKPITHLDLVDHNNEKVNLSRLKNKWTFVFFGFTHCPDVCPATLFQLAQLKKDIAKDSSITIPAQYYFISVDPDRDTLTHLSEYVTYFDKSFIGVTGDTNSILAFEKQLGAFHRLDKKRLDGSYSVQHSAEVFLIDNKGRLVTKFRPPLNTKEIASQISALVDILRQNIG